MKVGDKYFVREAYIENDYMAPEGEIVEIGYYKNTSTPLVVLLQFGNHKSHWFHVMALKQE